LREIIFTTIAFILLFMGISTIFGDSGLVGEVGASFGRLNREFFGVLSFIYPFALLYPAYKIYNDELEDIENLPSLILASLIFVVAILTLQGMIFDKFAGSISSNLYYFLNQYIGAFGTFLLIVSSIVLSVNLIFEVDLNSMDFSSVKEKISTLKESAKENFTLIKYNNTKNSELELFDLPLEEEMPKKVIKKLPKESDEIIDVSFDEIESELKNTINMVEESPKKQPKEIQKDEKSKKPAKNIDAKIVKEIAENKKLLSSIESGKKKENPKNFRLPKLDFLKTPPKRRRHINEAEIDKKIENLLHKLKQFKIDGDVVATYSGPVVTTFEFKPAANIKVSKILTLQDDLAMALKAKTIRIQAPIPGKDVVGIEIPNDESETIYLREILETKLFQNAASPLTMVVGKDIVGNPFVTDLKKLPHLLIAGTTGSGKSVGINAMLVSLLYRNSPDDLKFLMIDPKMLEFSIYNDIPHLLTPVITQAKQAIMALANMVLEMERRYKLMSKTKTKNIENYNEKAKKEGLYRSYY